MQAVEGGSVGTVSHNANGSDDLGVMQVNTVWLPALVRYTGLPPETVRQRLVNEPCFNIAAAGAIMALHLRENGGEVMGAVGDYHSRTPPLHDAYLAKVVTSAGRLFAPPANGKRG